MDKQTIDERMQAVCNIFLHAKTDINQDPAFYSDKAKAAIRQLVLDSLPGEPPGFWHAYCDGHAFCQLSSIKQSWDNQIK